jgi:hypothetical protein
MTGNDLLMTRALRMAQLDRLGPYFSVAAFEPRGRSSGPWRPFAELVDEPERLRARAEAVRGALAAGIRRPATEVPLTVAASVMQLGITARLLSPLLGLAALHGVDRLPSAADLQWQSSLAGAFPLAVPFDLMTAPAPASPDWDGWSERMAGLLGGLSRAVAVLVPSGHVRAGNIASAVNGAAGALAAGSGVPETARVRGTALAERLLALPELRHASTGTPGAEGFRRRNCCLLYRVAGPADGGDGPRFVCGDCILDGGRYRRTSVTP